MKPFFLLAALLILPLRGETDPFPYGKRPNSSVFDPADILTAQQRKTVSGPLDEIRKSEGLDVFVVILPRQLVGEAPPEHVARRFADQWCEAAIHAIVLHVPGHDDTPWIVPGGAMIRLVKPEVIHSTTNAAARRAATEPTDFGKIRAASTEAADALRFWLGGALLRSEELITERLRKQLEYENRRHLIKLAVAVSASALIPLIFGTVFVWLKVKSRGPRHFPSVRKQTRLGAPYAGGNHATTRIGPIS